MRLIDADAAIDELLKAFTFHDYAGEMSANVIRQMPTIEAEPKGSFYDGYAYCLMDFGKDTVLCKDCKYYDDIEDADVPGYRECHYFSCWAKAHYMTPIDSCTCAIRKSKEDL